MRYDTIRNPRTGEDYAVGMTDRGIVIIAAGPLQHSDARDEDSIRAILGNQPADELVADGAWLRDEFLAD